MQTVNYLGAYYALSELWSSFPEGGHEGDYALVGTTYYGWDKYQRTWVVTSVSGGAVIEDAPVGNDANNNAEIVEDASPEAASARNVNYRGSFDTIAAAWMTMPNGGQEGDYIAVSGNQYSWDIHQRQWVVTPEEDVVPIAPADLTLAAANSVDINYLGTFASIADVWAFYPEGGNEGEYVVVDDDIYSWDTSSRQWVESENETITIAQLELSPSQYRINYLGAFDDLDDVWTAYPEGGYEGDYIHLGEDEEITVWNKWGRNWGETGDPQTPAITSQTIPGSLTINYNLTVQGNIYGTVSNAVNASKWDNHAFSDYVNQALRTTDNVTFNKVTAGMFVKSGGTSSQFLKADGSVDENTYLTSADLGSYADSMAIVPATSIVLKHGNTVLSTLTKASLQELIGGGGTQVSWGTAIGSVQPLKVANEEKNLLRPQPNESGLLKADGSIDNSSYALASTLSSHTTDIGNPHQVTLAQVTNLASKIASICSWFDIDGDGNIYVTKNGNIARNFYSYGQVSAGGAGGGGGGGGGTQVSWGTAIGSVQPLKVANDERNLILARSGVSGLIKADGSIDNNTYQTEITESNKLDYSLISDAPSSLKNPYSLTFGSKTYDGSAAKTITASDLGAITAHQTVTLASGTNNGTLKLTVNGAATDNIAVKGLGTAAYKDESGTWAIGISGNAATATKFASAQSVALTGDITGSASSQAGWSIATTIGTGKVTNAMLAGSIANGKLANSSMTIAGTSVSLGGSITAATIGNALTSSAPAAYATTATNLNGGYCKVEENSTDWNFTNNYNRITALRCNDTAATGAPGAYHFGYSFITRYNGFQLVTQANVGIYKIRKVNSSSTWTDWVTLYHSGNVNLTTVGWSAKNLTLAGAITGATTGSFSGAVTADSLNITGSVADREYPAMVDSSSAYNIMLKANNVVGLMFDGQNCVIRRSGTVISLGSNSYRWGNYYGSACNINGALTLSGTSAATAKIEFSRTDSTNYILFPSSGAFAICRGTAANSNSAIYVGSDSNVGVGTYSPQYKLSLQGGVADFLNDNNSQDIHTKTTTAATFRIHYQNTADTMVRIALLARNNQGYYIGGGENGFAVSQQYYGAFNDRIFLKGGNGSDCGNVGIGNTAPAEKLHVTGNILATGQVTAGTASDIRLKTNVSPLKDADSILASLRPVEFDWNGLATSLCKANAGHDTGLIAQEVEEVMPQAVSPIWGDYKRVDYAKLTPVLVSGWQSHETQIQALKRKIYELEERLRNYGI